MGAKRENVCEGWQPGGDFRILCDCGWLRREQFRRNAHRVARGHADETGHTVELRQERYKVIRPISPVPEGSRPNG